MKNSCRETRHKDPQNCLWNNRPAADPGQLTNPITPPQLPNRRHGPCRLAERPLARPPVWALRGVARNTPRTLGEVARGMTSAIATTYSQSQPPSRRALSDPSAQPTDTRPMDWIPDISKTGKPRYLAIADAIAADIDGGRLAVGDRLPPQRRLAGQLGIDFTTVARGYVEAQKRGLIESTVGQGTFVKARQRPAAAPGRRRP
eukprot:gene27068-29830_t